MMQTDTTASLWPTVWIDWMLQDDDRSEDLHLKTSPLEAGLVPGPDRGNFKLCRDCRDFSQPGH